MDKTDFSPRIGLVLVQQMDFFGWRMPSIIRT